MPKVISFFNHKGGVGKTTSVHNIGYGLAKLDKKVLLIDADPQMNLTAAVYGLSTDVTYNEENTTKWQEYNQKFTSIEQLIRQILSPNREIVFNPYHAQYEDTGMDLLRGDIKMSALDSDLLGIINNKNELTKEYLMNFNDKLHDFFDAYDFVLIDLSPSSSSIINGIFSMTADYVIVPASPTLFSLQAVNNLEDVWRQWNSTLDDFKQTYNSLGLPIKSRFIGLIIQLGKRFKGGNARHTEDWKEIVNQGLQPFVKSHLSRSLNEDEYIGIFDKSTPYIIATYNNFTDKLRTICEEKGLPITALKQDDLPDERSQKEENRQYYKSWNSIQLTNEYICAKLLKLQ